jgi:hypothetical protein
MESVYDVFRGETEKDDAEKTLGCYRQGSGKRDRARSQGSNPSQTPVMALGTLLREHFPLDPIAYLRYKTSSSLTLWDAEWRRYGTTV